MQSSELTALERKGSDLVIKYGTSDQLTISNYFYDAGYRVEQIKFSDGVIWDGATINNNLMTLGDAGANSITGVSGASNRIFGLGGNDNLNGGTLADTIDGGDGNDTLTGNAGDDLLLAAAGTDTLNGNAGNDLLVGGINNDTLDGGAGSDTYQFALGDGVDTINDYETGTNHADTIEFTNVQSSELTALERKGSDLVIKYGTSDQLTVSNYFYDAVYRVEQIKFSDGVTWKDAEIKARVVTTGDANANSITGYNDGNNRIFGLAGNDNLNGGALADTIDGGDGNDTLTGNAGDDLLLAAAGTDTLNGNAGNDLLVGGINNDTLDGGAGSDTYQFALGDGVDTINDYETGTNHADTIEFTNVQSSELTALERKGSDLVIKYGTSDQLTVSNYFYDAVYRVEQIKFSDGVTWKDAEIKARVVTTGDANANSITGYNDGNNRIFGLAGNDNLNGGALADTIDGGDGNDTLTGNAGNDLLLAAAGTDTLYGNAGNDLLVGGLGNDTIDGGTGNDTYQLSLDSGFDVISDYDGSAGNFDVVEFVDVKSTDLTSIERKGHDLLLKYGSASQFTVSNYFYDAVYRIEQIKFSDGVNWDTTAVKARVMTYGDTNANSISSVSDASNRLFGLDGNDSLFGAAYADILDGGNGVDNLTGHAGNDMLHGGLGDDVLDGGEGNDFLLGGAGNDVITTGNGADVIALNRGHGQDTIVASTGKDNTLSLGNGIAYADLLFSKNNNDLVLTTGVDERVTLKDWYANANNRSVANLQMVIEASSDYDANSSEASKNQKVTQFNFDGLVSAFDQARTANPSLANWALSSTMLNFHLASSDTQAIGGDLAYQYGKNGNLSSVSAVPGQAILSNPQFAGSAQALQSSAALQDLSPRLM